MPRRRPYAGPPRPPRGWRRQPALWFLFLALFLFFRYCDSADRKPAGGERPAVSGVEFKALVIKVGDGDSLTARGVGDGLETRLRLYGVDAPELAQAGGRAARDNLERLALNRTVNVSARNVDQYGRLVAVVVNDQGENLAEAQLAAGQAWLYSAYCRADFCRRWRGLESLARESRLGLWAKPKPEPPWRWRKNRRDHAENLM